MCKRGAQLGSPRTTSQELIRRGIANSAELKCVSLRGSLAERGACETIHSFILLLALGCGEFAVTSSSEETVVADSIDVALNSWLSHALDVRCEGCTLQQHLQYQSWRLDDDEVGLGPLVRSVGSEAVWARCTQRLREFETSEERTSILFLMLRGRRLVRQPIVLDFDPSDETVLVQNLLLELWRVVEPTDPRDVAWIASVGRTGPFARRRLAIEALGHSATAEPLLLVLPSPEAIRRADVRHTAFALARCGTACTSYVDLLAESDNGDARHTAYMAAAIDATGVFANAVQRRVDPDSISTEERLYFDRGVGGVR